MAGAVVGIDLGTTNTVVAAVRGGKAVVLADEDGNRLLPSVVSFPPSGEVMVGRKARDRRLIDSRNTVYSVKRLIGRSWSSDEVEKARKRFPFELREGPTHGPLVVARGETYTLPEISAFVLRRAKEIAEKALGEPVDRAVVTVPASFNDLQRASTKVAAREAGLEVLRILNEPTAAALAYGFGKSGSERLAIYDFGGGTFDVTLLDLSGNVFEVIATAGDSFLGGDDIDLAISDRIAMNVISSTRFDPRNDSQLMERLRVAAEEVKVTLSSRETASIELTDLGYGAGGAPIETGFSMSRGELEALIASIVQRTFMVCQEAMQLARAQPSVFDTAILVGGSTRIPLVRRRVEEYFGKKALDRVNPDEVVAIGAAIQGAALTGAERRRAQTPAPIANANPEAVTATRIQTLGGLGGGGGKVSPSGARGPLAPPPPPRTTGRLVGPALGAEAEKKTADEITGTDDLPALASSTEPSQVARANLSNLADEALDERTSPNARAPLSSMRSTVKPSPMTAQGASIGGPTPKNAPAPIEDSVRASAPQGGQPSVDIRMARTTDPRAAALKPLDFGPNEPVTAPSNYGDEKTTDYTREQAAKLTADDWDAPPASAIPPARGQVRTQASTQIGVAPPTSKLPPLPASAGAAPPLPMMAPPPPPLSTEPSGPSQIPGGWSNRPPANAFEQPPLLIDVTPLSLSVETVRGYIDRVIARNSAVPCAQTRTFTTSKDEQQVIKLRVCQGESDSFGANTFIGELLLSGLRPARRGEVSIEVTFELDGDGILQVRARDIETSRETSVQMKLVGLDNLGASRAAHLL